MLAYLLELPLPHEGARIGVFEFLREAAHDLGPGGLRQEVELVEVLVDLRLTLAGRDEAHEQGAFGCFAAYYEVFHSVLDVFLLQI